MAQELKVEEVVTKQDEVDSTSSLSEVAGRVSN